MHEETLVIYSTCRPCVFKIIFHVCLLKLKLSLIGAYPWGDNYLQLQCTLVFSSTVHTKQKLHTK